MRAVERWHAADAEFLTAVVECRLFRAKHPGVALEEIAAIDEQRARRLAFEERNPAAGARVAADAVAMRRLVVASGGSRRGGLRLRHDLARALRLSADMETVSARYGSMDRVQRFRDEAIEILRLLAEAHPRRYRIWLARELVSRGCGSRALAEGVEILRQLAESDPESHDDEFETAWLKLACRHRSLGRRAEAMEIAIECVARARARAAARRECGGRELSSRLSTLIRFRREAGDLATSFVEQSEVVQIHRRLARGDRSECLGLAGALGELANLWRALFEPERAVEVGLESLATWNEALDLPRDRDSFPIPLVWQGGISAHHRVASDLAALGRHDEALLLAREALSFCRRAYPEPCVSEVECLERLERHAYRAGDRATALAAQEEAVRLARSIPEERGGSRWRLARSLETLANWYRFLRRDEEALAALAEAAELVLEDAPDGGAAPAWTRKAIERMVRKLTIARPGRSEADTQARKTRERLVSWLVDSERATREAAPGA